MTLKSIKIRAAKEITKNIIAGIVCVSIFSFFCIYMPGTVLLTENIGKTASIAGTICVCIGAGLDIWMIAKVADCVIEIVRNAKYSIDYFKKEKLLSR